MVETTLKDESVIEIGQTVTKGFNDLVNSGKSVLINPAGQPLTSGGDTGLEVEPERSPVMGVLEDIRDSMQSLVETFAESLSFQKQEEKEAERADRISQDDIAPPSSDDGGDTGGGFLAGIGEKLANLKDGAKSLLGKGGFMGLLIKGGLIAGLVLLAKGLQKYGKQIAEKIAPIVDGIKAFFNRLSEDIGPLLSDAFSIIGDTFSGIFKLVKGIFTLDGGLIKEGLDSLLTIPLRFYTFLTDAVASIINSIGAAFGVEGDITTNILNFFTNIKNKVVESFNNALSFFTEDIPAKVTEMKDSIASFFTDTFDKIKNGVKDAFSSVGNFFSDIGDSVKSLVNSAIDALPLPKFLKNKLKLETKASRAADDMVTETGIKAKYADDNITGMQRERMTGGGATMGEGFAEFEGEKYGKANIRQTNTFGQVQSASGIMTPEEFTKFNKLKSTDEQLQFLKNLDSTEQDRRKTVEKLYNDQKAHNEKLAQMIKDGKALQPEFGGEITSPDDQLLQDDLAYAQRTKQMKEDSAAMANREAGRMNVVNNTGGATNTNVANNTITNMAESTNTSDGNLRDALSA